ncbi:hypothetical protein HF969_01270 [Facklamia miroungae]|nr:hypothetical protein [Facklamia miroungae]
MSYTFSSNFITLLISTIVVLIIPKIVGIEDYGFWQLYIFYSSYVGFLHFGWNDGIYLRYGGEVYNELDKRLFFSQFIMLFISQFFFGIIIWLTSSFLISDLDRKFILKMVSLSMIIVNTRIMLIYILQATSRIKEYAKVTMFDRVIYIILVILFIIIGIKDYKLLIIADLIGKFMSLLYSMYFCKEIVFNRINNFYFSFKETFINISVGIKLLFANIASMLIIGIVRFGIEQTWDVSTFGKISLTLSISNMMMIFINAIGIIMFPMLRRTNKEKLSNIYTTFRDILMVFLLGILILYYPLKTAMVAWLPQYSESLLYMAIIFPTFIYEGKMALLISTYLKTLRLENIILKINLVSMIISLITTYICTEILYNLNLSILNIVILIIIRSILAEIFLSRSLKINVKKDIILEISLTFIFILTGWYINSWMSILFYGFFYILYLFIKRNELLNSFQSFKNLLKD